MGNNIRKCPRCQLGYSVGTERVYPHGGTACPLSGTVELLGLSILREARNTKNVSVMELGFDLTATTIHKVLRRKCWRKKRDLRAIKHKVRPFQELQMDIPKNAPE